MLYYTPIKKLTKKKKKHFPYRVEDSIKSCF